MLKRCWSRCDHSSTLSKEGRLVEVYFGFQKIEEIIKCYTEIRNAIDAWFQRMYQKALSLSELVGGSEERPRVCSGQRNRENYPAESAAEMNGGNTIPWRNLLRTQKSLQQGKEGTLWALCSNSSSNHVYVWGDQSELFRWMNHWKRQEASDYESISVSSLLAKHADNIFFPNVRELLKILAVLPMGSTEVERSFSCIWRIHT